MFDFIACFISGFIFVFLEFYVNFVNFQAPSSLLEALEGHLAALEVTLHYCSILSIYFVELENRIIMFLNWN